MDYTFIELLKTLTFFVLAVMILVFIKSIENHSTDIKIVLLVAMVATWFYLLHLL